MKRWVVYFSFLSVVIASEGVACAAQSKPLSTPEQRVAKGDGGIKAEHPATSEKDKDSSHDVTVVVKQENGLRDKRDKQEADENVNIQRRLSFYTGALALVGLFTFLAIIWQSCETRKAAQAAQASAEAALMNAKALIGAARPWLVVNILPVEDEPGYYVVRAINNGETPAEMIEGHCSCKLQPITGFIPPDDISDPFFAPMENLTFHGKEFEIRMIKPDACISEDDLRGINPKHLRVYGKIIYWDTFSDRTKTNPYVTQWDFTYTSRTKHFRHFYRSPGSYTKNT